jgi:hypothetical protein
MRTPKILIILLTFLNINTYAQDAKQYYTDAFNEQLAMLQGKKPIDCKRAVFITRIIVPILIKSACALYY